MIFLCAARLVCQSTYPVLLGIGFVTKRIARAVAKYKLGIAENPLTLAGLDMARDWGHAADYVYGMWLMLQQDEPRDFVLATGTKTTVREFVEAAFQRVDITVRYVRCTLEFRPEISSYRFCPLLMVTRWQGIGADLKGINVSNGDTVVSIDQKLIRASEVECLVGDSRSATSFLNWKPLHSLEVCHAISVVLSFFHHYFITPTNTV